MSEHLPETTCAEAVVIDLETRHADHASAMAVVTRAMNDARTRGISRIYLKIDSTLRGPISAQINATLTAWPDRSVIFAPAYPKMGRTVRGGVLYVNGSPLAETAFASDPLDPARTSRLADKLAACESVVPIANALELRSALSTRTTGVFLCDAETEDDLAQLASVVIENRSRCICAGSSGLLAHLIGLENSGYARSGLIVNGSRHVTSARQVARSGLSVFEPGASIVDVHSAIQRDGWAVLSTGANTEDRDFVLEITAAVIKDPAVESLTIFGGDTAARVLARLGVQAIFPIRELLPGIPISRIVVDGRSLKLVTKAGGFGDLDVVRQLRSALSGRE
jgi:uncharacterized protein YgbK (DUF1537 family)